MSFSLSFFIGSKLGKFTTIYAKVHYSGIVVKGSTGVKIDPKHWLHKKGSKTYAKAGTSSVASIANTTKFVKNKLDELFQEKANENFLPTTEEIKYAIKHHREKIIPKSFKEVKQDYLKYCSLEMAPKSKANIENSLVNVLEGFERFRGRQITFKSFNPAFSTEYKSYLITRNNPTFNKYRALKIADNRFRVIKSEETINYSNNEIVAIGLLNDTINKHFSFLKTFLKWAKENSYTNETGFSSLKPPSKSKEDPIILTEREVHQIELYTPPTTKQYLQRVKDVFLISVYTGQRISDLKEFQRDN